VKNQTTSPIAERSPLAEMFHDLRETLSAFTLEASELHRSVAVTDEATRAMLATLSRISAYCDQMHMIVALLSEDVRVTEEIGLEPAPEFDSIEHENCFYEWLRSSRKGGVVVN
jgi:hypothetical protein